MAPSSAPSVSPKRLSKMVIAGIVVGVLLVIGVVANLVSPSKENGDPAPEAAATTTRAAAPPPASTTVRTTTPPPIPEDQVLEGRGASVQRLDLDTTFVHIATITHQGRSNFVVWSVDANGDDIGLIVNEIGHYSGVRPIDFDETPAALRIEADGAWKIVIQAAQKAPLWTGESSGTGSAVLLVDPGTVRGLTTVQITHNGESNFVVWVYGSSRTDLLVNEIGEYSGESIVATWAVIVEIEADGPWSFAKT